MKKSVLFIFILAICSFTLVQIDKEQLALDVSKADTKNLEKLKDFIWKQHSTTTVKGEVKGTVIKEISFNEKGEVQINQVGEESSEKDKRGIKGKVQKNKKESTMKYVEKALQLSIAYTYMSKGQLLDFFEKAEVTEVDDTYQITGENVLVKGDKLTVIVEKSTNLFIIKKFSSMLDQDPLEGEIKFNKFSSGISYASFSTIDLPAQGMMIHTTNKDHSQRID
jgi:hypothetical protein